MYDKLAKYEEVADKREEERMKWQMEFWEKMEERRQQRDHEHEERVMSMMIGFMQRSLQPPYGYYNPPPPMPQFPPPPAPRPPSFYQTSDQDQESEQQ